MNISTQAHQNESSRQREVANHIASMWLPNLIECMDWASHLEHVDASTKRLKEEALRRELSAFDDLLARDIPEGWRLKEYRRRTVITLAGKITYLRRIYVEGCGICHALLDEVLGIRTRKRLAPDAFVWVVKMAAEVSFRKTARMFHQLTGAKISRWLVWECLQEEGHLILEEIYSRYRRSGSSGDDAQVHGRISQDTLFLEYDGIHIHEQKPNHERKRPRQTYEQNRHRRSFELKGAVAYAGKDARGKRVGLTHFIADAPPAHFWPLLSAHIANTYVAEDIRSIHVASDGAGWCTNSDIGAYFPKAQINHQLDIHHVNAEIYKAAVDGEEAASMLELTYSRSTGELIRRIGLLCEGADAKQQQRYRALRSYLASNKDLIDCTRKSMGTMEGTWAHTIGARMKVWGGAWSRRGGLCMALARFRIASGLPIIIPKPDNIFLSEEQRRRRLDHDEAKRTFNFHVPVTTGSGFECPRASIILQTRMAPKMYGWLHHS